MRTKKIALLMVLCVAILSPFIFATGDGQSVTSPEQAVKSLLEKLNKREITKIELHYLSWSVISYSSVMEQDIMNGHRDYKVVVYPQMLFHKGRFIRNLEEALRQFKFKKICTEDLDFRMCCQFYAKDKEIMRLSISKYEPAVSINGVAFDANPRIVYPFMSLLPMEAYQEMNWALIGEWLFDRSDPDSHKKSSATEQKR